MASSLHSLSKLRTASVPRHTQVTIYSISMLFAILCCNMRTIVLVWLSHTTNLLQKYSAKLCTAKCTFAPGQLRHRITSVYHSRRRLPSRKIKSNVHLCYSTKSDLFGASRRPHCLMRSSILSALCNNYMFALV